MNSISKQVNKNNFLVDKITFNIQVMIPIKYPDERYTFSYKKMRVNVHERGETTWLKFQTTHNCNRLAKNYFTSKYDAPKGRSKFNHSDNFIPPEMINFLKTEKNLKLKHIRNRALCLAYKESVQQTRDIVNFVLDKVSSPFKRETRKKVKTLWDEDKTIRSIAHVEIHYDVYTLNGHFLASSDELKESMQRNLSAIDQSDYVDEESNTKFKSLSQEEGHEPTRINGRFEGDNSKCKIYTKHVTEELTCTRMERSFQGYQILRRHIKTTVISKKDLKQKIRQLGKVTHSGFKFPDDPLELTTNQKKKVIKAFCAYFFKLYADEAYTSLTTGNKCIFTGKRGKNSNYVANKARELTRKGVLLKKKRVAQYCIDPEYIESNGNFTPSQ